jgi:hypothetical protein
MAAAVTAAASYTTRRDMTAIGSTLQIGSTP